QSITGSLHPNAGLGAFWHSSSSYIGISAPNVFEIQRYNDNDLQVYRERINYYLIGGHIFDIHENWQLKPAFLLKNTSGAPLQADLSLNAQAYERFLTGVSWRNSGAWAA
ncbi:type IX secretion system membrane protein PorP/SprF, partial [Arthrospira platensis SPKY1]|nr:type IX secretion system membrane protein PorP/SprF [Arthrospira platensis SPKY1]